MLKKKIPMGSIDGIIWEEFKQTPPEQRAAEKLWKKGFTSEELWKAHNSNPTCLPTPIWVKTMNALRDIENNFPKPRGGKTK